MISISAIQITIDHQAPTHSDRGDGHPDPVFMSALSRQIMAIGPEERIVPEKLERDDGFPPRPPPGNFLSIIQQRTFHLGLGPHRFEPVTDGEDPLAGVDGPDPLDLFSLDGENENEEKDNALEGLLGMLFLVLDRLSDLVRDLYHANAAELPQSPLSDNPTNEEELADEEEEGETIELDIGPENA